MSIEAGKRAVAEIKTRQKEGRRIRHYVMRFTSDESTVKYLGPVDVWVDVPVAQSDPTAKILVQEAFLKVCDSHPRDEDALFEK